MSLPALPDAASADADAAADPAVAGSGGRHLAELTTLRLGGPVGRFVETSTEADLIETVRSADAAGEPLLVIGGGSNLVVADGGFPGVVVRDARRGLEIEAADTCGGASITVPAGAVWDDVVARAVAEGWIGVEALAGIPGSAGAAPVQNIGAYGQELAGVVASVRVWDREQSRVRTLPLVDLAFGYRTSVLKRSLTAPGTPWGPTPRFVVLDLSLQMYLGDLSAPIGYPELARRLDVAVGERARTPDVRAAVLELRRGKGMVLDADDPDTWSAGSFFTNPILDVDQAAALPATAPRYPVQSGRPARSSGPHAQEVEAGLTKTSAAWLIEHAGFGRSFGLPGTVGLSTKHVLALTNRGDGTTAELLALARVVRDGVQSAFGVVLEPEPVLVGCSLDES
ncbi:UDP-N-acetylmuramate dehydrogenase [Pengzhenrongella frigida]|uniref:UDP-N-acetylenolpyruvoylglucosamine reductase n=1 Tax=Pengzhenrongella frigida TaxID=1259133 RepID=A0A4Q5MZ14_9MICO|nr:UDP-N-acetylmuramate dehydrogenase [Cellulomonas sp. HLT2-17]RYV51072.1 UDP-N-acetylmuramate dehydrogenase [Cellulomonas sp. HLT2-17]